MSINVHVIYGEKENENFTIGEDKKKIYEFIMSNEKYNELSEDFRKELETEKPEPYIDLTISIYGTDWHPYEAPSWGYYGGDPGCPAGYDDFEMDDFHLGEDGDQNIFDTFSNVGIKMTENDKNILKDIFSGENIYPTAEAPFVNVTIDENGEYDIEVSDKFEKSEFADWVTDDDLRNLDEDVPEPDYDYDDDRW